MVGRHHRLDGHESEQAPGVGDGQGGLASCSPWGRKESDVTQRLKRSDRHASQKLGSGEWGEAERGQAHSDTHPAAPG